MHEQLGRYSLLSGRGPLGECVGVARMHCYMPDGLNDDGVIKLPISLPRSDWSVWVLSHTDLRKTRRVQRCREFLLQSLKRKQGLFEGESTG